MHFQCDVCKKTLPISELTPARFVRHPMAMLIEKEHPAWNAESRICRDDLNRYRSQYVEDVLEQERGELTSLERDVILSLKQQDILSQNLNEQISDSTTFGQKLADRVASFGGSWMFILSFAGCMATWILLNTLMASTKPFDPYPFILLNLILSCLAAIQAPIIMMSQNRQEAKDRLRAENDYRVNLKAELEIRHLHSKIDILITHQWQRLLEIQQVQTDLLAELQQKN